MEFATHSPVLSGIAGGLIAAALGVWWAPWLPRGRNGKSPAILQSEYRVAIWTCNGLTLLGLMGGVAMYRWGGYASNDWRPAALCVGAALSAPLLTLPLAAMIRGGSVPEAFEAFALANKSPTWIIFPILAFGPALLIFGLFTI